MYSALFTLIFAGVLMAGVWKAWDSFTSGYITQGATAQKVVDQQAVNLAEARATRAEADAKAAAVAARTQSEAATMEAQRTEVAVAESRRIGAAYSAVVKSSEKRIADLKAAASAVPVAGQTCSAVLEKADQILRDSARVLNQR